MSKLRVAVTTAAIAAWVLLVVGLYFRAEDEKDAFFKAHHCKKVDVSDLWSYIPIACSGCSPVPMTPDTFDCDGKWTNR